MNEDIGIVKGDFHPLGISDHVGADVALVELKSFHHFEGGSHGLAVLDGNDAVLADLVHGFGDELAYALVIGGDGSHLGNLVPVLHGDGLLLELVDHEVDGPFDAGTHKHSVGAGSHVLHSLCDDGPGENSCGGGAVSGDVVGLGSDFLHQLGAGVLVHILKLDLLGDGDSVVGDGGRTELLLQNHVPALGPEGDTNGVGNFIDTAEHRAAGFFSENKNLSHVFLPPLEDETTSR